MEWIIMKIRIKERKRKVVDGMNYNKDKNKQNYIVDGIYYNEDKKKKEKKSS